jgi:hypothetical protein
LTDQGLLAHPLLESLNIDDLLGFFLPEDVVQIKIVITDLTGLGLETTLYHRQTFAEISIHVFVHFEYLASEVVTLLDTVLVVPQRNVLEFAQSNQLLVEVGVEGELLETDDDLEPFLVEGHRRRSVPHLLLEEEIEENLGEELHLPGQEQLVDLDNDGLKLSSDLVVDELCFQEVSQVRIAFMLPLLLEETVTAGEHLLFISLVHDPLVQRKLHLLTPQDLVGEGRLLEHAVQKRLVFFVQQTNRKLVHQEGQTKRHACLRHFFLLLVIPEAAW